MRNFFWKKPIAFLVLTVMVGGSIAATKQLANEKPSLLLEAKQLIADSKNQQLVTSDNTAARWADRADLELIKLPAPPFKYQLAIPAQKKSSAQLQLRQIQAKANSITDQEEWLKNNHLTLPDYQIPDPSRNAQGNLPAFIPERFRDQILVKAIRCKDTILLIYGADFGENRYLIVVNTNSGEYHYGFDFINYAYSPEYIRQDKDFVYQRINWAFTEDNILYVSHAHSTYARSSKGLNAYITAIDIKTAGVLWRTRPLVANAGNFEIIGNTIITGYGFTDEPDYLYLLDKGTGEVYQQIKLKSGPEHILMKGNELYVRTYNRDYLFAVYRP